MLAGGLVLVILGTMITSRHVANRMIRGHGPRINAVQQVRVDVTTAHLLFDQMLRDEDRADAAAVEQHLDHAAAQVATLLHGGAVQAGATPIPAVADDGLRAQVLAMQEHLRSLRESSRVVAATASGDTASQPSREVVRGTYEDSFLALVDEADRLETDLRQSLRRQDRRHETLELVLALLLPVAAGVFIAGFVHMERRRTADMAAAEQAQAEAQRHRELLLTTMDCMADGLITTDSGHRITYINQVASSLTGFERSDALGQPVHMVLQLVDAQSETPLDEPLESLLYSPDGAPAMGRCSVVALDGTTTPVRTSAAPIIAADERRGAVLVLHDLSARRELEAQLLQSQKLEAVGRLAGGVAHDFNNLLTSIIGYSEIALMKLAKTDPMYHKIDQIFETGHRAADLTRQLLAFSRRQLIEKKLLDLNTVIERSSKLLRRLIGEDVEMELMVSDDVGAIMADPTQIEQIVMNLALNARDFMPGGGRLTIETDVALLDEDYARTHEGIVPGPYVVLSVTDTGEGIAEKDLEKIFDPFFTTKSRGKGTGLGLATVYGLVHQHDARIYVYSELGIGTTFKIFFPQAEGTPEDLLERRPESLRPGSETVLVVDDEPSIRRLISDTLTPLGYTVVEAASGTEALAAIDSVAPALDLLLTDVIMPDMNGRDLADKVKSRQPGIEVLFMSGYTDNVIAHHGVLNPGVNFIAKPIIPSVLAQRLRELLD